MNTVAKPQAHLMEYRFGLQARQPVGQRGFTLVELMIAIVMGLLIMIALIAVFLNVSRTNTEMRKTNGLIENGRFAINLLQTDLELAGYWGGYVPDFDDLNSTTVPASTPTAEPSPCLAFAAPWTSTDKNNLIGIPVQTFDAVPTGCTSQLASKKTNTDVLVVRYAEACAAGVGSCTAATVNDVYFQTSFCSSEISAGGRYKLDVNTGLDRTKLNCTSIADKRKYVSDIYYIRDFASTAGDGIPTLMRSTFEAAAQSAAIPLIEGIEGFVVELGIDAKSRCGTAADYTTATIMYPATAASSVQRVEPVSCAVVPATPASNTLPPNRGDGVPESYVHCTGAGGCTSAQLSNVVVAKVYVLARSTEAASGHADTKTYALGSTTLGPFNDSFKRHVYQTTVRLPNISGRRNTP